MHLEHKDCPECGKHTAFHNGKCSECEFKKASYEHRKHFAGLKGLTIEERLDLLEKWQWDLMKQQPWIDKRVY